MKDPRVDSYISNSQPFAKPILTHLRKLVHQACPGVIETIKWGMPFFEYKGPLCNLAAFKKHMAFGFWKQGIMPSLKIAAKNSESAMGSLGRITSMDDLPADRAIVKLIKEAMELNEKGAKVPKEKKKTHRGLVAPDYFLKAIGANKKAWETYESFSPTNKKEYI